jgi:enoyl-CoA hydratase
MKKVVTYEVVDGVALVTIRRPEKLNAINPDVLTGLQAAWERLGSGPERCAVLTGEGDRAFSAGMDFNEPATDFSMAVPGLGVPLDKPVVAAVSGYCVGGAYVLVLHCDLAVATRSAQFRYPEAKIGLFGGLGSTGALRIPHKIAMQMLLLGGPLDVQRAFDIGLVNEIVDEGMHVETALTWARQIAESAPLVISAMKRLVDSFVATSPVEQYFRVRHLLKRIEDSQDMKEGLEAARDRRKRAFHGK